jgi:sterol desaturase/sphingolipid hydroxylase (fatty acid hydroxylase superfamily)
MHAFILEALRLTVWLALLAAIFVPLERLVAVRPQRVFRKQIAIDLAYYVMNSVLIGVVLAVPLSLLGAAVHNLMPGGFLAAVAGLPVGVRLGLSVLLAETGFYWGHRWSHEVPLLWRFHAVHHSAEEVDFLSNTRAHPVDMVLTRLCGFVPVFALGLAQGPALPAVVVVIGTMWGFFVHANVRWRFGFLESVVATPFFHRWHHTNDAWRDRNYAAMLPVLDRVFGTFHLPAAWPTEYGIDTQMPATLGGQLMSPLGPRGPSVMTVRE